VFNRRNTQSILRIEHLAPTKNLSPRGTFNKASKMIVSKIDNLAKVVLILKDFKKALCPLAAMPN
jgi:hypothetical protein